MSLTDKIKTAGLILPPVTKVGGPMLMIRRDEIQRAIPSENPTNDARGQLKKVVKVKLPLVKQTLPSVAGL